MGALNRGPLTGTTQPLARLQIEPSGQSVAPRAQLARVQPRLTRRSRRGSIAISCAAARVGLDVVEQTHKSAR